MAGFMERLASGVLLCAAVLLAGTVVAEAEKPAGAIALFNGKDLSGWYTFLKERGRGSDPKGVFTVSGGMLRISGEEWGCITTEKEFENYQLTAEWRWSGPTHGDRAERARDSGILVHSVGDDGGYSGTWMHSIEVQMIEGGTGDFIVVGDKTDAYQITVPCAAERQNTTPVFEAGGAPVTVNSGRVNWWGRAAEWTDTLNFRGPRDVERPVGEWNTLEITAMGARILVVLNGVTVNEALAAKPSRGRIQIQSEGAALELRRIELLPLGREDGK